MKTLCSVLIVLLLSGCATQVPISISKPTVSNITLAESLAEPERFAGNKVRWGGVITTVENKATQTWVEVVGHKLKKNGKPLEESHSSGRFIASIEGFADPVVYSTGHLFTVVGTIEGQTTQPIGDYNYSFPIVKVSSSYLWPVEREPDYQNYPPPWWYYDPWPFYPYPYYGPYLPHRHRR